VTGTLRAALRLLKRVIRMLAADTDLWADPVWLVDSTPVECARSRPAVLRSELAGVAGYGWCRALPLPLGTAAASDLHPGRAANRLGAGRSHSG